MLGSAEHLIIGEQRKLGYLRAMEEHDIPVKDELMVICDTIEHAEQIVPELLKLDPPPDAFFTVNDFTAAGTLSIVKSNGKKVPEDIAIVGFTNSRISTITDPQMSSVDQFGYEMGRKAAEMLIRRLTSQQDYPIRKEVIKTRLIVRGSSVR